MKNISVLRIILVFSIFFSYKHSGSVVYCQGEVEALKARLNTLSLLSSNTYFINHCKAFLSVIDAKGEITDADISFLTDTYTAFTNPDLEGDPSLLSSYLNRQRPFIISWVSPTDGEVSFSWLKLPADWNPDKVYPLYIELHGFWNVANDPIEYLTYPFRQDASDNFAFEDGYLLSPWGRGNLWYQGISETDIWECMASLEKTVKIDPSRKFLCGHSMGGYGAWSIGLKSINTWAALGIHAGALWYDDYVLQDEAFETLKNMPVYFVVGNADGLYNVNLSANGKLKAAGNKNTEFVTFNGGHDYLDVNVQNMYLWMRDFTNDDWYLSFDDSSNSRSPTIRIRCTPNPVKEHAILTYKLEVPSEIIIDLYDSLGKVVENIFTGFKYFGDHNFDFDASGLPSGTYTLKLKTRGMESELKIVVIK
jgi:hypothetical protein